MFSLLPGDFPKPKLSVIYDGNAVFIQLLIVSQIKAYLWHHPSLGNNVWTDRGHPHILYTMFTFLSHSHKNQWLEVTLTVIWGYYVMICSAFFTEGCNILLYFYNVMFRVSKHYCNKQNISRHIALCYHIQWPAFCVRLQDDYPCLPVYVQCYLYHWY